MRISVAQILLLALGNTVGMASPAVGQAVLDAKISVSAENNTIKNTLKNISNRYQIEFVYSPTAIDANRKISSKLENQSLAFFLKNALRPYGIDYKIHENKVILYAKPAGTEMEESRLEKQVRTIKGRVVDETGKPLGGVSVVAAGTTAGTTSDASGGYELPIPDGATSLTFSFIGYLKQEVQIGNQTVINVSLTVDNQALSEVVVVGYGTQKRSDVTGAVSTINVNTAKAIPTTNISEMIRGQAAGVAVSLGSARPGGTSNILIRGQRSITGSNAPLVVLDGFPIENINDVNPDDIASIEILKDASSQAIYGARASNGVILITSKKGKEGKTAIAASTYLTSQKLTKNFDLYSPEEFAQFRREAKRTSNGGVFLPKDADNFGGEKAPEYLNYIAGNFADWEDAVLKNGRISNSTLSINGGSAQTKVFSSLNYFNQSGLIPSSGYKRGNFRLNLNHKVSEKISIEANLNAALDEQKKESTGLDFITINPFTGPYDINGNLVNNVAGVNASSSTINPLWNIRESSNDVKSNFYNLNLVGNYKILDNLTYKINALFSNKNVDEGSYRTRLHQEGMGSVNGKAMVSDLKRQEYLIENILTYKLNIGDIHDIDVTAVQSINQIDNSLTSTQANNFPNDLLGYKGISSALNFKTLRNDDRRRLLSYMGRVRYSLLDKYLVTVTARQDGASVFSANDKWSFFPAASLAWKIHQEEFLKPVSAINELKARVSYGSVGNQALSPYQTLGLVNVHNYVFNGNIVGGSLPGSQLPNPGITWETSTTLNAGLDFGLLENRITGSVDYYTTRTRDLLLTVPVNSLTGFTSTIANGGESKNSGIEALVNYAIIRNQDFKWSINATFAKNKNEIVKTGLVDAQGRPRDDENNSRFIGSPITVINSYAFDGIFQTDEEAKSSAQANTPNFQTPASLIAGAIRLKDINGDGIINDDDKVRYKTQPDWIGSFATTFSYKGIDLLADFYYVKGAMKRNPYLSDFNQGGTFQSVRNGIKVDYWTPERPSNEYPRPSFDMAPANIGALSVTDASYFRLRTFSVGYTLPKSFVSKANLSSLRFYFTGTNLWTATKYKSYNPENNPNEFPDAKSFTFGINLGL
ncbi:TonB-dependent receptor [Sphingobacterium psychroaquaticum]|uniref:TonB-dependent receptor n=1 Tax=Sphingobacterium psychroaquaticum TaxID=561061 RepID=UPI001F0D46FC|nr:TonB-dependent receptor [Sphingobacterium psychroaquaticum]